MKKIILIVVSLFLFGCAKENATSEVFLFYSNYQNLSSDIYSGISQMVNVENLSQENKELYKKVYIRQYQDMIFSIDSIKYSGKNAYISTTIEVYDFSKVQEDVSKFLSENEELFNDDNNNYDVDKYYNYKFNEMLNTTKRIKYNITLNLIKNNNKWYINNIDDTTLSKINGIYQNN